MSTLILCITAVTVISFIAGWKFGRQVSKTEVLALQELLNTNSKSCKCSSGCGCTSEP